MRPALLLLALFLTGCDPVSNSLEVTERGVWTSVPPPPGAPKGTLCWTWISRANSQLAVGGPTCFPPPPDCR